MSRVLQAMWVTVGSVLLMAAPVGCASRPAAESGAAGDVPKIATITPDSVSTARGEIVEVTLAGAGFDATENTVAIGPVTLTRVPSSQDGRTLRFAVPLTMSVAGGAPPVPLRGGRFPVTVTNARGVSNAVTLTIQ